MSNCKGQSKTGEDFLRDQKTQTIHIRKEERQKLLKGHIV